MPNFNATYRPQRVSELDLVSIKEGLEKVLKSDNIPHAFLFAGPRGTGKTSAARIVAKAVNCLERGKNFEPCNKCQQCISITNGSNLDVLEIDAASNRGIDDIRALRERVRLAPATAKYKVYIIDEAHMLTMEAFNALLKILEEPPKHVIFILCTTSAEKLPETIISRCTRFNFQRATPNEIKGKLLKIGVNEGLKAEDEAMAEIAKAASGSFRDATKILEQVSYTKVNITKDMVKEVLGQVAGVDPQKLLDPLVVKNTRGALLELQKVVESGISLVVYTEQLLELLRNVLLAKFNAAQIEVPAENLKLEPEEIRRIITLLSQAAMEIKDSVIPQLPLEMAVIEWCGESEKSAEPENPSGSENKPQVTIPSAPKKMTSNFVTPLSLETIQSKWREVLLAVRPKNYSVEALLRATRPVRFEDELLTLEVFYQFHKDKLESEKCRKIVEDAVSELFGFPAKVRCLLGERSKLQVETKPLPEIPESDTPQPKKDGEDDDIVKVAEEIFNAQ